MSDIRSAFVPSPGILKIIEAIKSQRGNTHRRCPPNILVTGKSGSGKTTLIEHLKNRFPRRTSESDDKDIVPVVVLSFPKDVSQLYMISSLLEQLGDPDYKERDLDLAYKKLWKFLEDCEVEILLIDELHNIQRGLSRKVSPLARAFIKDICTHTKVLMVGFGTEEAEMLLETEPELDTRFQHFESMPVYSVYDGQRPVFRKYLEKLSAYLDVKNPEIIYQGDFPERLYFVTRALPRTIAHLIDGAILKASKAGRNKLINKDFEEAALALRPCRRQAKVFNLRSDKVYELVSKNAYKDPEDYRSFEIVKDMFDQKGVFNDMVYQADKVVLGAKP